MPASVKQKPRVERSLKRSTKTFGDLELNLLPNRRFRSRRQEGICPDPWRFFSFELFKELWPRGNCCVVDLQPWSDDSSSAKGGGNGCAASIYYSATLSGHCPDVGDFRSAMLRGANLASSRLSEDATHSLHHGVGHIPWVTTLSAHIAIAASPPLR